VVTNQKDPDDLGRVKVKFPWMYGVDGAEIESDWVRIASPMAGDKRGLMFMPEINDEVLLAFEHGDAHAPYVLGSLWSSKFKPPLPNADAAKNGKVEQRIIKSRVGHIILMDDTSGKEMIVIRDKTEKNEIIIDSAKNTLTINVDKDVAITAKGNMTFKSTGDMLLDAKNITVKTLQNLTMKATQNAEIKATANIVLEATAQLNLKGTAGASLKAAVASIALTGPSVNVNNGALEVI
jgi:uncharacterized protein involved in type VI secretion and phage assembly